MTGSLLRVEAICEKPDWLHSVAGFLHDAELTARPSVSAGVFTMPLRRIGWELGSEAGRWLRIFRTWHYPWVGATLRIGPLAESEDYGLEDHWKGDSVLSAHLQTRPLLRRSRRAPRLMIQCAISGPRLPLLPTTALELEDTATPDTTESPLVVIGGPIYEGGFEAVLNGGRV